MRLRATRGQAHRQALREVAGREGWLEASSVMPDDAALAQVLQHPSSRPQSAASVLLYQDKVTAWWRQCIRGTVIHQALVDTCGYASSYSSIRRFLQGLKGAHPDVTTELDFDPGDVAQVDFGRGPTIKDVLTHQSIATWIFVMVLAWSRHQYAEIVPDQKVETWLCCHRSAFEFFGERRHS